MTTYEKLIAAEHAVNVAVADGADLLAPVGDLMLALVAYRQAQKMRDAATWGLIKKAESFISGFEDDETQDEPVNPWLGEARAWLDLHCAIDPQDVPPSGKIETIEQLNAALSLLVVQMSAKALVKPDSFVIITANIRPSLSLSWDDKTAQYGRTTKGFFHNDLNAALAEAQAFVAGLPSAEEAKQTRFMNALAAAIEEGRESGIDVEIVNPLQALMIKLSENAITDQSAKA